MAQEALKHLSSGKNISYYEALDRSGKITHEQLKQYITLREDLGQFDNAALADKYVLAG